MMRRLTVSAALAVLVASLGWTTSANALSLANMPWTDFVKKSELVVKVQLVKWELENYKETYTFKVSQTFKGPKDVKTIVMVPGSPMTGQSLGPVTLKSEGILYLKKDGDRWVFATDGRCWWPYTWERKPGHASIIRVGISLLTGLPDALKKTALKLISPLVNGKWHEYDAQIYVKEDVEAFLKAHVK